MLAEVKTHLERGAELLASHVPALAEWAAKAEADPLVQAAVFMLALIFVLINFFVDVLYTYLDPRVAYK